MRIIMKNHAYEAPYIKIKRYYEETRNNKVFKKKSTTYKLEGYCEQMSL